MVLNSALDLGVWTFTGVICDQYDHNNKNWRQNKLKIHLIVLHSALDNNKKWGQNELKKITVGYGVPLHPWQIVSAKRCCLSLHMTQSFKGLHDHNYLDYTGGGGPQNGAKVNYEIMGTLTNLFDPLLYISPCWMNQFELSQKVSS